MPELINTQEFLYNNLLKTEQTTCYAIGDAGDKEKGQSKIYEIKTADQFSDTVNVDCPHYAAATIAFAATTPGTITDAAGLLATVLTGDTIVISGSGSNDGVYTVSTGGVAGTIRTTEATILEAVGAYITISKRVTHSNNAVIDLRSDPRFQRRMWARYVQTGKVGAASDGQLNWYTATTCFTLHPDAADLAMVAGNILRIEGSDESSRYFAGQVLDCAGFANAVNNLPCLVVKSVSFTGGNTDIVIDPGDQTLIAEVAAGARSISLVCQSIYSYAAAANVAGLGGYSDWRICNVSELSSLIVWETGVPDAIAFPSFPATEVWTSTTSPANTSNACVIRGNFASHVFARNKATEGPYYCILVRGG